MSHLDELVDALLHEGYALYPYTPGATKNATPTPFGIVYPPVYAAGSSVTFDHLELQCVLAEGIDGPVNATVRFLVGSGHEDQSQSRSASGAPGDGRSSRSPYQERRIELTRSSPAVVLTGPVSARAILTVRPTSEGFAQVTVRVENTTRVADGLDRGEALRSSLLSTHVVVSSPGGRFVSPLERDGPEGRAVAAAGSVNTFPVLATDSDDAVLGAAIMLPDHPQIAPESRGDLFDGTEIEEALLLHVHALSDAERAEIEAGDPAVREMIARAAASTPQEILRLHGRMELRDPRPRDVEEER